jgi:hypothetical protein
VLCREERFSCHSTISCLSSSSSIVRLAGGGMMGGEEMLVAVVAVLEGVMV